jgi:hypothetical protein
MVTHQLRQLKHDLIRARAPEETGAPDVMSSSVDDGLRVCRNQRADRGTIKTHQPCDADIEAGRLRVVVRNEGYGLASKALDLAYTIVIDAASPPHHDTVPCHTRTRSIPPAFAVVT